MWRALIPLALLGPACEEEPPVAPAPAEVAPLSFDVERLICSELHRAVSEARACEGRVQAGLAALDPEAVRRATARSRSQSGENAARWDAAVSRCAEALAEVRRACDEDPTQAERLYEALSPILDEEDAR